MLSAVTQPKRSYPAMPLYTTTGTPAACSTWSSRTRVNSSQFSTPMADRDRTVSRRSEPNSRTTLIGEQPNPWELLHPRDVMSRHRGAKQFRR
jgi:hypothetical protein